MIRFLLASILGLVLSSIAYSADNAATESKIKSLLTTPKSWTLYKEFTEAPTPSDRAEKHIWEYFERDGKLIGRRVLAFGGCELEISVRGDEISVRHCDQRWTGERLLSYDPNDSKYPFKSGIKDQNPSKFWLQAND